MSSLRDIASDVSRRIADRQLNDTTMSALLYAKFKVNAPELKQIGMEIEKRASQSTESEGDAGKEYRNLMRELHQNFASTRQKLVVPLMRRKIGDMLMAPSTSNDIVAFARSIINYTRSICLDEYDLWKEWFEGDDGLYGFLESVCEPLYDVLRPRIIHEVRLLKLCEICTLIQTRYTHDFDDDAEPSEPGRVEFTVLIRPALEDTQTRLVFRTQAFIRDEIEYYKPKPAEVDALIGRIKTLISQSANKGSVPGRDTSNSPPETPLPKIPMVIEKDEDFLDSKELGYSFSTEPESEGWYPTLGKAIWLLSRIYRLVNVRRGP